MRDEPASERCVSAIRNGVVVHSPPRWHDMSGGDETRAVNASMRRVFRVTEEQGIMNKYLRSVSM